MGEAKRELAVRQIVNSSLISEEVIDVFAAAGLNRPDISILCWQRWYRPGS